MNNQNHPKRLNAEANWTNFLESRSAANPNAKTDIEDRIGKMTPCDLSQGHMDDLEVDSVIRELARSGSDEHEFVGKLLTKLELPNSNPIPRKKTRLPVPAPVFEVDGEPPEVQKSILRKAIASKWITPQTLLVASSLTAAVAIAFFANGLNLIPNAPELAGRLNPMESSAANAGDSNLINNGLATTNSDAKDSSSNWIFDGELFEPSELDQAANTNIEIVDTNPLRPYKRWKFAIDFDKYGLGTMTVNGTQVPGLAFRDTSFPVLSSIGEAVKERFELLQPRLNSTIGGTVSVNGKDFRFGTPAGIDDAIAKAGQYMAKLPVEPMSEEDFMSRRAEYIREQEFQSFLSAGSKQAIQFLQVDLLNAFRDNPLSTPDETAAVSSVVQATESFLRDWSNEVVQWESKTGQTPSATGDSQFSESEFNGFREKGEMLAIKKPARVRATKTLQKLNAEELQSELFTSTRSLDIFKNAKQSKEAAIHVQKNDLRGVSKKTEQMSRQLANIEKQLENFAANKHRSNRQEVTQLEKQYVSLADELEDHRRKNGVEPLLEFLEERPTLKGLPLVMGDECHMEPNQARSMSQVSKSLGATLARFDRFASRDSKQNDSFRFNMVRNSMTQQSQNFTDGHALVTLDQMLQIDHPRVRVEFIKSLSKSDAETRSEILARHAKFDLMPEVRLAATKALAEIDPEEYRQQLLDGFDYPWHVIAEHSAEALARLDDKDAVDDLVSLLKAPAPHLPRKSDNGKYVMREVVAINHMKNCFLCHAPSTGRSDRGRAVVPTWNEPLPPKYYNASNGGSFVRADTTYLRQDFSVMQTVEEPGHWPKVQRFDYVTYRNELSNEEARDYFRQHQNSENRHRNAVLFALRQLTGLNPADNSHATWVAEVAKFKKARKQNR